MAMIETKKLRKTFGHIEAVRGVSFRVDKGEVLGFLGPNGAGKSTVMRMLACFLTPTAGTAAIGGHDILDDPMAVRRMIGYLPESNPAYGDMTVTAFLKFVGEMRGYRGRELGERVAGSIDLCALGDVRHQVFDTLSKGFQRRVGLAQTFIHDPPVLILDEPTDGLDPNQKHEVRALIRRLAADKAIIVSTHILEEVDAVCTRTIIIARGRLVADGTPEELKQRSRYHGAVHLAVRADRQEVDDKALRVLPGVGEVERIDPDEGDEGLVRFNIFPESGRSISRQIAALAHDKNWEVDEMGVESGHLDEVFRDITTREDTRS